MGHKKHFRKPVDVICADPGIGLTATQVQTRLLCGWSNRTNSDLLRSDGQIILRHCATFFNLIFLIMATLLMLAGSTIIKLSFLAVVIINTVISCVQEIRAKRAVEKLTLLAEQTGTYPGVEKAFAIQAGREVRIMVKPEEVSEDNMIILARDIAKKIEAELEYPGQIKVNCIRETKAVEYAK